MAKPLLNFCDIGAIRERACCRCGSKRVWPQSFRRNPEPLVIVHHDVAVNRAGGALFRSVAPNCMSRAKRLSAGVASVPGRFQVFFQKLDRRRVRWDVTNL